jgi:hypothetical protein
MMIIQMKTGWGSGKNWCLRQAIGLQDHPSLNKNDSLLTGRRPENLREAEENSAEEGGGGENGSTTASDGGEFDLDAAMSTGGEAPVDDLQNRLLLVLSHLSYFILRHLFSVRRYPCRGPHR